MRLRRLFLRWRTAGGCARGRSLRMHQVLLPEPQKPAAAHDARRKFVASREQLVQVDFLAALDALYKRQVRGCEQADVVRVLAINALETLGDHEADARELLGSRAVFARRTLAIP